MVVGRDGPPTTDNGAAEVEVGGSILFGETGSMFDFGRAGTTASVCVAGDLSVDFPRMLAQEKRFFFFSATFTDTAEGTAGIVDDESAGLSIADKDCEGACAVERGGPLISVSVARLLAVLPRMPFHDRRWCFFSSAGRAGAAEIENIEAVKDGEPVC